MSRFCTLFENRKSIIAMIHVQAISGTPLNRLSPREIIKQAMKEAKLYKACGIRSVIIENMHDRPYQNRKASPEVIALMAIIAHEIKTKLNLIVGIQILAGANTEALAVAHSAGIDFIRSEGFIFGHLADEGYMDSDASFLLRYRKQIDAEQVLILTDIKKKHSSHAVTSDLSIADHARAAEFFLSDGLIITGTSTGMEPDIDEISSVKEQTDLPLILGSGITVDNISDYFDKADAFIIGSHFKIRGKWENHPDIQRIKNFVNYFNHCLKIT